MFPKWKIKLTFAKLVIISMILGIGCGITFGERCSSLAQSKENKRGAG